MVHFANKGELHIKNDTYKQKNGGISMKRKITTRIRRIVSLCLALAMMLASTTVYAASTYANPVDRTNEVKTVSYDMETGETTYEVYQVDDLSDVNSLAITTDEYGTNPLYDGIIGMDNRVRITNTTDSPYRNICCLEITFPDGKTYMGSGVLVYFDVMLTAGHCVYNEEYGGWATSIKITPGRNGQDNEPFGVAYPTNISCSKEWVDKSNHDGDWAIVDLNRSFDTWQLYGYYSNIYSQLGTSVTAIGYPAQFQYYMYADTNSISYVTEYQYTVLCDMTGGQSGGALIDVRSGYLIGINTWVEEITAGEEYANHCLRLTPELCNIIKARRE